MKFVLKLFFLLLFSSVAAAQSYTPVSGSYQWTRGKFNVLHAPYNRNYPGLGATPDSGRLLYEQGYLWIHTDTGYRKISFIDDVPVNVLDSARRSNDTLYFRTTGGGEIGVKMEGIPILGVNYLQDSLNIRVKYSDTLPMLSAYLRKVDTTGKWKPLSWFPGVSEVTGLQDSLTARYTKTQSDARYLQGNQTITLTGDVLGSGTTGITTTLKNTGSAGTYTKVTTDAQGRVSSGTNLSSGDIPDLSGTYIPVSEKAAVNGVATLGANGKIPSNQIPAVAISETFVVASQAAMLALTAETGDVAVRTDVSKSFILTAEPASTLGNWQELLTPTAPVQSVNGQTGNVVVTKADVGLGNADNTSDLNKPISTATQTALNGKEPTISAGTTAQYWRGDKTWQDFVTAARASVSAGTGLNYASGAFSANFGTAAGTIAQGNDSRINNGQTAFSWGNHASAGYVPGSRTLTAGTGLTGGGDLTANRSFAIDPAYSSFTNYYTKTNLQTSGQAAVHYNNLTNVPSSWPTSSNWQTTLANGNISTGITPVTSIDPALGGGLYGLGNYEARSTTYPSYGFHRPGNAGMALYLGDIDPADLRIRTSSNVDYKVWHDGYAPVATPTLQQVTGAGNTTTSSVAVGYGAGNGYVTISPAVGGSGWTGYYLPNTTRLGYIGSHPTDMHYVAENSARHVFSGGRMLVNDPPDDGSNMVQVLGGISSVGSAAGYTFGDRTVTGTWAWYADNNYARLYSHISGQDNILVHSGTGAVSIHGKTLMPTLSGIAGTGSGAPNVAYFSFYENDGVTSQGWIGIGSGSNSDMYVNSDVGNLNLATGGQVRTHITSDGRVGIGTASPAHKFVVSNGGAEGLEISTSSSNPGQKVYIQNYDRSASAYRPLEYAASAHHFTNGNVGIGTTSDNGYNLQVNGGATFANGNFTIASNSATTINGHVTAVNGLTIGGSGSLQIPAGAGSGKVLTSDGSGVASWQTLGTGAGVIPLFIQTANEQVSNTTFFTSLVGTGTGTNVIPANSFSSGQNLHVKIRGTLSTVTPPGTIRLLFEIGGASAITSPITLPGSVTKHWEFIGDITCRTTGVSGSVMMSGMFRMMSNPVSGFATTEELPVVLAIEPATLNTTVDNAVDFRVAYSVADPSNTISSKIFVITKETLGVSP